MKKQPEVYLGDKIETTKHFKPELSDGSTQDLAEEVLAGVVVNRIGDLYGVKFEKEYPFTHFLGDMLTNPFGCALNRRDFKVTKNYDNKDKKKKEFINILRERHYSRAQKIPREIENERRNSESCANDIKSIQRDINNLKGNMLKHDYKIKELKSVPGIDSVDTKKLEKQYDKFSSNKKIKSLEVIKNENLEKFILVTTEDLTFVDKRKDLPTYNLGAYKILIPLSENSNQIGIINYKRHVQCKYFHPCVNSPMSQCLGRTIEDLMRQYLNNSSYIDLTYLMISFLEEPNYSHPHLDARLFAAAQDVTIRPRDPMNWFKDSYWREHETFNGRKYTKESKEYNSKYTGHNLTREQREAMGRGEEISITEEQPARDADELSEMLTTNEVQPEVAQSAMSAGSIN